MELEKKEILQLELLKHVEESPRLNNRMAAAKLGCSVKLAHELLGRMVDKGLFHVKKHHARRWDYFLTPKGISEKARLTYEFLDFSMHFYREARKRSSQLCRDLAEQGTKRVSFIGASDLAEIVYLGVKEWNLELVNVFAATNKKQFMGVPIRPYSDLINCQNLTTIDKQPSINIVVCLYDKSKPTDMNSKYLPEELTQLLTTNIYPPKLQRRRNLQQSTNIHWIF